VYLAASHHGKVRLNIRALPGEVRPPSREARFARGIWDGDELAEADLGDGVRATSLALDLEPMLLGSASNGSPSWLTRTIALRDRLGVFRLAFLESVVRAADVRASMHPEVTLP
jgi:CRISPR-associated endonuclease/helicase Cas3